MPWRESGGFGRRASAGRGHFPSEVASENGQRAFWRYPADDAGEQSRILGRSGGCSTRRHVYFLRSATAPPAGAQTLSPGATTLISAVATGRAPAGGGRNGEGAPSLVAGAGSAAGASGQRNVPVVKRGVTVTGEVKNYIPVTPRDAPESHLRGTGLSSGAIISGKATVRSIRLRAITSRSCS